MDHLWSPWRYRYVTQGDSPRESCIFCHPENREVVFRGQFCYGLLNAFPYTNGHMMIAPYEHVSRIEDLAEEPWLEMMRYARLAERNIRAAYRCDGLNLGFNVGSVAGAGIAGHLHLHVLPRWQGDANFMSTIGETRVHPEGLDATLEKLRACDWVLPA